MQAAAKVTFSCFSWKQCTKQKIGRFLISEDTSQFFFGALRPFSSPSGNASRIELSRKALTRSRVIADEDVDRARLEREAGMPVGWP